MKAIVPILVLVFFLAAPCSSLVAGTQYVIANDNNLNENHLTVFRLDTSVGSLTQIASLPTNGTGLGDLFQNNNYSHIEQAVSPGAACIFAINAATSDIAAFSKASGYSLVGNYSNSGLDSSYDGGSLALTPNGKYLYGSYSASANVGAWALNTDCSLTFIAAYSAATLGSAGVIKVAPNGLSLVLSSADELFPAGDLFAINSKLGTLTDLGSLTFCHPGACLIRGIDITQDSKIAIFSAGFSGNGGTIVPIVLTAHITPHGLTNPHFWSLKNRAGVAGNDTPFLSASGFLGNGNLYFGMDNGVVTTTFTEVPLAVTLSNATVIAPTTADGVIGVADTVMVMAQYPSQIGVLSINSDGSVSQLSTAAIPGANPGLFSLSLYPTNR